MTAACRARLRSTYRQASSPKRLGDHLHRTAHARIEASGQTIILELVMIHRLRCQMVECVGHDPLRLAIGDQVRGERAPQATGIEPKLFAKARRRAQPVGGVLQEPGELARGQMKQVLAHGRLQVRSRARAHEDRYRDPSGRCCPQASFAVARLSSIRRSRCFAHERSI